MKIMWRILLSVITAISLSACGFTSDEPQVEYVQETGFVKELDESETRILVNIHDKFEDEERLTWFIVSNKEFQEIGVEDKVSVIYNSRVAQIAQPPVYEVKSMKVIG